MAEVEVTNTLPRDFSKVILSLQNVLLPEEKLSPTPSLTDGLDTDTEWDLRILGCELIQTSGFLLKLPQVAMATGQALFQRFYFSKSFVKHSMEILAMASINLAAKIEEAPRRIRDVINVFHHIKQVKNAKTISPLILDQNYINLKNNVIKAERRVLKELGFCVHVQHPHKMIVMFLQVLECERNQKLVQFAWNYMNDSFRTVAFLKYQPETVACACIYLAARKLQIPLPNNPHWFLLFNVMEDDIRDVCQQVLSLYTRPKADVDNLEKKVNEAKKLHVEAKRKLKGLASESATPNSRPVSPHKESPSAVNIPAIKKILSEDDQSDRSFGRDLEPSRRRKRGHSRSPSVSKSRSYSSSRSRSGSVDGDYRRYSSSKKHKHNSHHSKDRYTSNTSTSAPDKNSKDRYSSDKYSSDKYSSDKYYDRYPEKYSDRHSNDRYLEKDRYPLSSKHDPKYDAYNYRDYKDKEKSRDHKRSSGKHRDNSYSPVAERSPIHKKSYHRDRRHSRSRSPVDKHRSKKHASNGRSRSDRDRDRYSRR